jgi:DNA replication protein DnaC
LVKLGSIKQKQYSSSLKNSDILVREAAKRQLDLKIEKAENPYLQQLAQGQPEYEYNCNTCKDTGFADNKKMQLLHTKEINHLYVQSDLGDNYEKGEF